MSGARLRASDHVVQLDQPPALHDLEEGAQPAWCLALAVCRGTVHQLQQCQQDQKHFLQFVLIVFQVYVTDPSRSMEFKAIGVVGCFLYTSGLPFTASLGHLDLPKLRLPDSATLTQTP